MVKDIVNGYPMQLNQAKLERELLQLQSPLLKALQTYLADYGQQYAPGKLTTRSSRKTTPTRSSRTSTRWYSTGAPTGLKAQVVRYKWGITPQELELTNDYLMLGLSGFVEDPTAKNPMAPVSRLQVTRPPLLNLLNPTTFDAAIAINEDLVNRILALGYNRGYLPRLTSRAARR